MTDLYLEARRQMIHAAGIITMLFPLYLGRHYSILILGPFLIVLLLSSFFRSRRKEMRKFLIVEPLLKLEDSFDNLVCTAERKREREAFPLKGAIFFYTGVFFAVVAFPEVNAAAAIAVLAIGDSISTMVGLKYGKHKLPINRKKSWEGSLAFLYSSYAVLLLFAGPITALITAAIATIVEMLPELDDNLTIPIIVGFVLTII